MHRKQFQGKVALITGGSSGIGRTAALVFERKGASVVIASRGRGLGDPVVREPADFGADALIIPTDVSLAEAVQELDRSAVERFGRLDYTFNNAGTLDVGAFKSTAEFLEEELDRHIATNLKGVWLCLDAASNLTGRSLIVDGGVTSPCR